MRTLSVLLLFLKLTLFINFNRYYHKEMTGEEYTFEVPCLRTSKHCNTRRMASSGRNHTHPLEIVRPETDYSYYERAVALRQETVRLGMPAST